MMRTDVAASVLTLLFTSVCATACTSSSDGTAGTGPAGATGGSTGGTGAQGATPGSSTPRSDGGDPGGGDPDGGTIMGDDGGSPMTSDGGPTGGIDGKKDGTETDVDCGGDAAPKCTEGKSCLVDSDCQVACSYAQRCVSAPSCTTHLGGDTCGLGEVGEPGAMHESCCRSLPVPGYSDAAHPGKTVYLDKYEITAGRVRAFVAAMAAANGGKPNVLAYLNSHPPQIWDHAWDVFMPTGNDGGSKVIARRLLGDPRPEDQHVVGPPGPGVILPPATDQPRNMGMSYQFGSEVYVDLHGSDCATWAGSYGFPTYYYPPDVLAHDNEVARPSAIGNLGQPIAPQDALDVKAMNCITNAMLVAFCTWDGGQLATNEVMDYVTATPATLGNVSGCGTQYDNHGELLGNIFTHTLQIGGRCAPVSLINATFDGGDNLPVPGSPLNFHGYHYPDTGMTDADKSWEVAPPGRASLAAAAMGKEMDVVRINPGDEPWMDLAGNLSEAVLDVSGATFTGKFGLKYRGIGYGTARSDLNMTLMAGETILRIQRPEAKAGFMGGRCMRFK